MLKNRTWCPIINCNQLWRLVPKEMKKKVLAQPRDNVELAPLVDVVEAGYAKVLGKGRIPRQPLVVRARYFSKRAQAKIKAVGGKCLLRA